MENRPYRYRRAHIKIDTMLELWVFDDSAPGVIGRIECVCCRWPIDFPHEGTITCPKCKAVYEVIDKE